MAKKFGKFLLFTAAVAAAGAGVYYYLNKDKFSDDDFEDDDYDDFDEDFEDDEIRSYVALDHEQAPADTDSKQEVAEESKEDADFESLASIAPEVEENSSKAEEAAQVEEFFDEDETEE